MNYNISIKKEARKALKVLSRVDRHRITEKIVMLGIDPEDDQLDVKKLQGQAYYRLRVVGWRVIFDKDDVVKIISIEKIKARGGAYK